MSRQSELAELSRIYDSSALSNRNLIINGAMQVAQRGTSSTGITSQGYRTVDRFKVTMQSGGAGTWTETQESDGPSGFSNSHKVLCTTANASLGSGAYFFISQHMEAQNFQHLDYGSSGAKTLALSFYVKSNKTGTYNFELSNSDASSLYYNTHQYTISSANTWEKKTIIITGSTSDAIDNNNQKGLNVTFWLLAGTDYSGGTYNEDTWHGTEADRAVGNVNLADATNNYWQITGVQLEVGDTATPFEHRSYGDELARCQRYYTEAPGNTTTLMLRPDGFRFVPWYFPVTMRTAPTVAFGSYNPDGGSTSGATTAIEVNKVMLRSNGIESGSGRNPSFTDCTADAEL